MALTIPPDQNYFSILRKYWGYPVFRDYQEEIIQAILNHQDVIAVLPTGSGKSITFQIPALLCPGTALVVSPLIALMNDQVNRLKDKGIHAATWQGGMNRSKLDLLIEDLYISKIKMLYISPERIENPLFLKVIQEISLSFLVVDEVHCISQWGHDFRPAYRKIATLSGIIPNLQIVALTATATPKVEKDVIENLGLENPLRIRSSVVRENLVYQVIKNQDAYSVLPKIVIKNKTSQIIYFRSRKMTENIQQFLQHRNYQSTAYHAGLAYQDREKITQDWMTNKTPVMCSTTAFGMGIDKPDVRRIIHFHLPESLEAYVQETGRAGRDSRPAQAILLFAKTDLDFTLKQLQHSFPTIDFILNVYKKLAHYSDLAVGSIGISFPFDLAEFSHRYKLSPRPVISALQQLEWAGYLVYTEGYYQPSTLLIKGVKQDLYEAKMAKEESQIMQSTLRLYEGIMQFPQVVREAKISKNSGLHEQDVKKILVGLHQKGVIDYHPANDLPKVLFVNERYRSTDLIISEERINVLKQIKTDQLHKMIDFANTTTCRTQFIAEYFGDEIPPCGTCDNCLEQDNPTEKKIWYRVQNLLKNGDILLEDFMVKFPSPQQREVINCLQAMEEENLIIIQNRVIKWLEKD